MANKETSNHFQANFEDITEKVSNAEENQIIKNNLRDLPECPVCLEEIKTIPIFECKNGHVICSDCIPKLEKCPICRNNSLPVRSSKSEEVILEVMGLQSENMKSQNLRWGLGSQPNSESNVGGIESISSLVRIEIGNGAFNPAAISRSRRRNENIEAIPKIIALLIILGWLIFWIYEASI